MKVLSLKYFSEFFPARISEQVGKMVTLRLSAREALNSNLDRDTGFLDREF